MVLEGDQDLLAGRFFLASCCIAFATVFLHRFLEHFRLPTNEVLPALESNPIRFGKSFDVFPFTVDKCCEVDARKPELAHKFGEVKRRRLDGALFRFDVVGQGDLSSRTTVAGYLGSFRDGLLLSSELAAGLLSSDTAAFTGLVLSETVPFSIGLLILGHGSFFHRFAIFGHDVYSFGRSTVLAS